MQYPGPTAGVGGRVQSSVHMPMNVGTDAACTGMARIIMIGPKSLPRNTPKVCAQEGNFSDLWEMELKEKFRCQNFGNPQILGSLKNSEKDISHGKIKKLCRDFFFFAPK